MADEVLTKRVEVFRPGKFRAMNGAELTFTAADVAAIAASYDPAKSPAPVVVGHPQHDDPAFGWADGFEVNSDGVLVAEISKLAPAFVDAVKEGRYRKISMKFFPPNAPSNPVPGSYYPRHIGFLGGAAPAVPGLAPVQFTEAGDDEMVEVSFADEAFRDVAGLFRRLRETLIEKFGMETADAALPDYTIGWIAEAGQKPQGQSAFSAAPLPNTETKEIKMSQSDTDALNLREAELARREAALNHIEHVAFADGLIAGGKLLPVIKDRAVALLDQLVVQGGGDIAFTDGDTPKSSSAVALLRGILEDAPKAFTLGRHDLGVAPNDSGFGPAFAVADGMNVDPSQLKIHERALRHQNLHPGTDYLTAVRAVQVEQ